MLTYLLECTLKQDLTPKPLHRYRRVLALLRMPKVLEMYSIGAKRQTIKPINHGFVLKQELPASYMSYQVMCFQGKDVIMSCQSTQMKPRPTQVNC